MYITTPSKTVATELGPDWQLSLNGCCIYHVDDANPNTTPLSLPDAVVMLKAIEALNGY